METLTMKLTEHKIHDHDGRTNGGMQEECIICCISSMLRQEDQYVCHGYLDDDFDAADDMQTSNDDVAIDESCRAKMAEWIFHVIDSTRLQRDTASVSMDLLDRFLCTESHRATQARANRKEYQLAAMTCLYIAVKIYEPFELDANLMSRLSRGIHSAEEITTLEYEILVSLQWKLANPTPFQFVNYLLSLLPESAKPVAPLLYENSYFQTELAAGDYAFACIKSSTVAVASILNSMGSALGGVDQSSSAFNECVKYIREISRAFELDIDSPLVNTVRERLLNAFAKQSGYELSQGVVNVLSQPQDPSSSKESSPFEESPTCVAKEAAISLDIYE